MAARTGQDIGVDPLAPYFAGDDLMIEFEVDDAAGEPLDVSAWTFTWSAWPGTEAIAAAPAAVTRDSATPGHFDLLDAATGLVRVRIDGDDTVDLGGMVFGHRLMAVDHTGDNHAIATGTWAIAAGPPPPPAA
jgi:hypothetical protein